MVPDQTTLPTNMGHGQHLIIYCIKGKGHPLFLSDIWTGFRYQLQEVSNAMGRLRMA